MVPTTPARRKGLDWLFCFFKMGFDEDFFRWMALDVGCVWTSKSAMVKFFFLFFFPGVVVGKGRSLHG